MYYYSLGDGTPDAGGRGGPSRRDRTGRGGWNSSTWATPRRGSRTWGKRLTRRSAAIPGWTSSSWPATSSTGATSGPTGTTSSSAPSRSSTAAGHALRRQPRIPRPGAAALHARSSTARERAGRASTPTSSITFEYGGAFFAVLDSTLAVVSPTQARKQADWLDGSLPRRRRDVEVRDVPPPGLCVAPRRDNPVIREHWVPVFDKHHVDLVLQGHDHAYLRTYPMRGEPAGLDAGGGDDLRRLGLGRQVRRPGERDYTRSASPDSRPIRRSRSTRSPTASPIAPGPTRARPSTPRHRQARAGTVGGRWS